MKSASFDVCGGRSGFPNLTGMCRILLVASVVLISWSFTACGVRDDRSGSPALGTNASTAAASMPLKSGGTAQILLFNGTGTSPNDVTALETILKGKNVNYSKVNSSQLNAMSESRMREYGLLIVPGGNFIDIGNGLTPGATANIRNAVQNGLNYFGVCAGAFFAGNSPTNVFESDFRREVRVLRGGGSRSSQSSDADYRGRGPNARTLLGGWPTAYRLGRLSASIPTAARQSCKEHVAAGG